MKAGSSLIAMRRLFPEMSDECLVYICFRRAYRRSGLYRSVVGGCRSRIVRVCDRRSALGCWSLRPMRHPLRITDAKPEKRSKVDQVRPVGCRKAPPPRCVGLLREAASVPHAAPALVLSRSCKGRGLAYLLAQMPAQLSSCSGRSAVAGVGFGRGVQLRSRPMRPGS